MNWAHVKLIFHREVRDQLRDRRTMFTICVLPLLLYPLMGMVMMQVAQFHREQHVSIAVVGYENWPALPPLFDEADTKSRIRWKRFAIESQLAESVSQATLPVLAPMNTESPDLHVIKSDTKSAESLLRRSDADVIVCIPKGYGLAHCQSTIDYQQSEMGAITTRHPIARHSHRQLAPGMDAIATSGFRCWRRGTRST